MVSPARRRIYRAFIVLLWIPVVALALEIYARFEYRRAPTLDGLPSRAVRAVSEAFHPDLWQNQWKEYAPHSTASIEEEGSAYSVHINSDGYRGKELDRERDDPFVIACLGGSTTVEGPRDDATYPALLESFLNAEASRPVAVVNCGVSGLQSAGYKEAAARIAATVEPDLVVEYNGINDLCNFLVPRWRATLGPVRRMLLHSRFCTLFLGDLFVPDGGTVREDIRNLSIKRLRETADLLSDRGIPMCVASFAFPPPERMNEAEAQYFDHNVRYSWRTDFISYRRYCELVEIYNGELKAAFEDSEIVHLPLAESAAFAVGDFFDICHMSPDGIRKKAATLASLVRPLVE